MQFLVGVGACYLDTILTVSHYPAEDEKLRASSLGRRRGGNCPNTLEVLQQLLDHDQNAPVSLLLCAVLPSRDSVATEQIKASLSPKVDLSRCLYREASTEAASSYIIKSDSTGSRTIVNFNELAEMTAEEFIKLADSLGHGAGWYHFEGRIPDVTLRCIKYLRSHFPAARISVEAEKPGRPGLEALASLADVVFFSKSWAQAKGYHTPRQCLDQESHRFNDGCLLCCTWGDQGAVALQTGELTYEAVGAYKVGDAAVVDTIGAGDTFIAGMLYGLTCRSNWPIFKMLMFANELAGRKVLQEGFNDLGNQMRHAIENS